MLERTCRICKLTKQLKFFDTNIKNVCTDCYGHITIRICERCKRPAGEVQLATSASVCNDCIKIELEQLQAKAQTEATTPVASARITECRRRLRIKQKTCLCCREFKDTNLFSERFPRICSHCVQSGKYSNLVEERKKEARARHNERRTKQKKGELVISSPFECQLCKKIIDVSGTHTLNLGTKTFITCHHCATTVTKLPHKYREIHTSRDEESWFRNEDI